MDRLSPELVLEIFDLAVHSGDESYPGFLARVPQQDGEELSRRFFKCDEYPKFVAGIAAHETNTTSPVHLGHVCQHWREVVFGCVPLLELWLEKSGEQLLKEYREEYREYDDEEEEGTDEGTREEAEGKRIVEMLELVATHKRTPVAPSQSSREPPSLGAGVPVSQNQIGLQMELLASGVCDPPRTGLRKHIPCDRLSALTLHNVTINFYDELLQLLPKLEALRRFAISLGVSQERYEHRAKRPAITLPSLQQLVIVAHCNLCNNNVLSLLDLPSLTDLSVHTSSCHRSVKLNLQACLDKWKPQLRRLALRDEKAGVFEDSYSSLLHHCALRAVSDLRLGGVVTEKLLHALTPRDGSTVTLLPALERVHFEAVLSNSTPDFCPLTQLVLARSNSALPARLQSVYAGFERVEDIEAENAFWDLSEAKNPSLGKVVKRFIWIGTGPWKLDREFMCSDFSLIQGWEGRAFR
ncbi:hypothetical protein FA13DRAFT_1719104 [Coprinellus micaceus]|uniref:F-box domain-containing protein n=1 Tax=Coprinellus micaceus TaxID=71717 RepID=A0A4Y7SC82_COPMI|nr:hypothetical protein FA13DRAFT_1719104 [Coprinellus micaceus]